MEKYQCFSHWKAIKVDVRKHEIKPQCHAPFPFPKIHKTEVPKISKKGI